MKFLLRTLGIFVAVALAIFLLPGLSVSPAGSSAGAILIIALVIALLNATVKPILQALGAPFTIISLGVFYVVINAALLYLAAGISNALFGVNFAIDNFATAFVGALIISIVSAIMNSVTGANDQD
jgi:putative membrane protein